MRLESALAALSLCVCFGCSSDEPAGGGGSGGSAGSASAGNAGGGKAGSNAAGAGGAGGASGAAVGGTPSEACQKYCTCHEANCASQAIPGDKSCAEFCTGMSEDQLACRQNMCGLVPAQPDNDHCKHSVGIDQCL